MLGFGESVEANPFAPASDWPSAVEPLLYGVLCDMPQEVAQLAVLRDGPERGKAIANLCIRVVERAKVKSMERSNIEQLKALLGSLIRAAKPYGIMEITEAQNAAKRHGVEGKFIEELIEIAFYSYKGTELILFFGTDFQHFLAWSEIVAQ